MGGVYIHVSVSGYWLKTFDLNFWYIFEYCPAQSLYYPQQRMRDAIPTVSEQTSHFLILSYSVVSICIYFTISKQVLICSGVCVFAPGWSGRACYLMFCFFFPFFYWDFSWQFMEISLYIKKFNPSSMPEVVNIFPIVSSAFDFVTALSGYNNVTRLGLRAFL